MPGARQADARHVNATTIEITLELELDGENVAGTATDANGARRPFSGWIGLMGVVDSLLDGARNTSPGNDVKEGENDADS